MQYNKYIKQEFVYMSNLINLAMLFYMWFIGNERITRKRFNTHFKVMQKNIFTSFLTLLNVKHTNAFSNKYYNEHPHKYNLFGLSRMLFDYGVKNAGIKIENKEQDFFEIPTPFIAHIGNDLVIIDKITESNVRYIWNNSTISSSIKDFLSIWTGVILFAEPDENSIEPEYKKHRRHKLFDVIQKSIIVISASLFILTTYIFYNLYKNIGITIFLTISAIGVFISYLLAMKQINIHSEYADKICSLFKQSDCNNVLRSKVAKLWGVIGWSEVGLGYFISNILITIFFPQFFPQVALINICALPYSIWSVWYQKFRAKQWCPLCLIVQILLWLLFINNLIFNAVSIFSLNIFHIIYISYIYLAAIFSFNILIPKLSVRKKLERVTQELNSIKTKDDVFASILKAQPRYEVCKATSSILFGNQNAEILVTVLTNPHCNPCAIMHKRIDSLLKTADDKVCVQYVFSSFDESLDSSCIFLIAAYFKGESTSVFNDWFEYGKNNREKFFRQHTLNLDAENVAEEFYRHAKWKQDAGFSATPTILVNGYKLPDSYKIEDIKYFSRID